MRVIHSSRRPSAAVWPFQDAAIGDAARRLRPLTERIFKRLPDPRLLWIAAWALVPWLNAGANLLLDDETRSAIWEQSRTLVILNYSALSVAIVITLWGAERIARRLETSSGTGRSPGPASLRTTRGPTLRAAWPRPSAPFHPYTRRIEPPSGLPLRLRGAFVRSIVRSSPHTTGARAFIPVVQTASMSARSSRRLHPPTVSSESARVPMSATTHVAKNLAKALSRRRTFGRSCGGRQSSAFRTTRRASTSSFHMILMT